MLGKTLDYGPMNHDYRLWTGSLLPITNPPITLHSSPILAIVDEVAKWAGYVQGEGREG